MEPSSVFLTCNTFCIYTRARTLLDVICSSISESKYTEILYHISSLSSSTEISNTIQEEEELIKKNMKMLKQSKTAKVLKGLSLAAKSVRGRRSSDYESAGGRGAARRVPEGHFVVVAVKGEETKRFIVRLECLSDPAFLRLLERASEEYGFGQKGPLAVPCNPQELQNIIDNHMRCT